MSKYEPLWNYIKNENKDELKLSHDEISKILNFKLDHSFLSFKKELLEYGYEVKKISLKESFIIFKKVN